ncbi:hypothetical protein [Pontibacter sp. BAB1700]|uniref:hypothetical protein n=1 Tax=Pontibacter sp. BAB1700 TaxID=1144253 RepID=UPI00026BE140|nr:hypothetical protein [Pontibacter sp. BAB1700]EJF08936.1 hypothetical protein O71_18001 [Pontibacter sp. BAB1700]
MDTALRSRNATIEWSYPYLLENAFTKDICYEGYGVYCISRVFNSKETILYIGKTNCNFFSRLNKHYFKWVDNYRGIKKVRFGTIISPLAHTDELIHDLEGGLIFDLQPLHNICRKISYTYYSIYKINNIGYRGGIPRIINMKEH